MLLPPSTSSSSPAVPSSIYAAMRQRINMRQIIMQGNPILMLPNLVAVAAAAQHCEHLRSPCGGSIVCQAGNILPHLGLPLIAISMIIITIYSQTIAAGKWFGEYYGTVPESLQETDRDQWPPPALLCTLQSLQRDLTLAPSDPCCVCIILRPIRLRFAQQQQPTVLWKKKEDESNWRLCRTVSALIEDCSITSQIAAENQ